MANKVVFGLKNVHVAFLTESTGVYATPVAIPGAVSLSLSAEGEASPFYADDIEYYSALANNGYTGDLNMALVPDATLATMHGWEVDENGMLVELTDGTRSPFALLFEIDGDVARKRHVLYKCLAARPDENHNTKAAGVEPSTTTVKLTAYPIEIDDVSVVKGSIERTTANASVFDAFFTAVVEPSYASA